jgi:hypothetical protein
MDDRTEEVHTVSQLEQCPGCLQLYAYELEYRCNACDGPLCPTCIVRVEMSWVCSDCAEEP